MSENAPRPNEHRQLMLHPVYLPSPSFPVSEAGRMRDPGDLYEIPDHTTGKTHWVTGQWFNRREKEIVAEVMANPQPAYLITKRDGKPVILALDPKTDEVSEIDPDAMVDITDLEEGTPLSKLAAVLLEEE